jgi:ABC-2 type transport system permease protein
MAQLLKILGFKVRAAVKGLLLFRLQTVVRDFASLSVLVGFSVVMFFFARFVTSYLLFESHIGLFLFHRFLSMVLFVFFLAINLGNLVVAYSTLYKTDEVDFLLTQPVSYEKIFVIKFLDNFFHSSSTLFLIAASVLAGYGSTFDMPWTFYLFVMVGMVIPFMLLAAALAIMILFGLMLLASRVRFRQLIGALLCLYLASVFVYFKLVNPVQLTEQVMKFYPNVNEYFSQFDPKFVTFLPNHWIADALYYIVRGDLRAAAPYVEVLLLATIAAVVFVHLLAWRFYYPTWLVAHELRFVRKENSSRRMPFFDLEKESIFNSQTEVLLKKDFWQFFREPSQWLHLLILLFLVVVFIVSLSSAQLNVSVPFLQAVSYLGIMTFNGFLIASIALRFVFPAMSLEGLSFWSLRSGPVPIKKVFLLKFVTLFLFILVVAELLSILSNYSLREHTPLVLATIVTSLCFSIGLVGLNLGAGAYFANYREKNAIRVASSQEASLTFLLSLGFLLLVVAILFLPVQQYFQYFVLGRKYSEASLTAGLLIIFGLSVLIASMASFVGLRSLERDF